MAKPPGGLGFTDETLTCSWRPSPYVIPHLSLSLSSLPVIYRCNGGKTLVTHKSLILFVGVVGLFKADVIAIYREYH